MAGKNTKKPEQINPVEILKKYGPQDQKAQKILLKHSVAVAELAKKIAQKQGLPPDKQSFVERAAMLHDIGIGKTNTPQLFCSGKSPYICHGILGRKILENIGLFPEALVAERHIGVGITKLDIKTRKLPLPMRQMSPVTLEEKIIAFADKYYSKSSKDVSQRKSTKMVLEGLKTFGQNKVEIFLSWLDIFGEP